MNETEIEYLHNRHFNLRVRVLANLLYQQKRQSIFETREGFVKVASLAAGSVALTKVADPGAVNAMIAVIFVGTAGSLVFGWSTKAKDAAKRCSEWTGLQAEIDRVGERGYTEEQLCQWQASCTSIESGEPSPNTRLFGNCTSKAATALGSPGAKTKRMPWWLFVPILP